MLHYARRLRATEIQLLIIVLIFFAAGYLLLVATTGTQEFIPTLPVIADILWPSVLPFLLFLLVSIGMSWRMPQTDQTILPLVALLAGMGLLMIARMEPSLSEDFAGIDAKQSLWVTLGIIALSIILFVPWDDLF